MSHVQRVCALCLVGLVVGCGGSGSLSTANSGPLPPHEGTLVQFPDGRGLVEVVKKSGKAPITAEVSFYFYQNAYKPFENGPEAGFLVIDQKRRVSLQADGDALVTPTGPVLFANKDVDGVLSIELDGEPIQIPLGLR